MQYVLVLQKKMVMFDMLSFYFATSLAILLPFVPLIVALCCMVGFFLCCSDEVLNDERSDS